MSLPATLMIAQATAILERAASLPPGHGLLLRINWLEPDGPPQPALRARQTFYRIRQEMSPAYEELQFLLTQDDPDHQIIILRRSPREPGSEPSPVRLLSADDLDL